MKYNKVNLRYFDVWPIKTMTSVRLIPPGNDDCEVNDIQSMMSVRLIPPGNDVCEVHDIQSMMSVMLMTSKQWRLWCNCQITNLLLLGGKYKQNLYLELEKNLKLLSIRWKNYYFNTNYCYTLYVESIGFVTLALHD